MRTFQSFLNDLREYNQPPCTNAPIPEQIGWESYVKQPIEFRESDLRLAYQNGGLCIINEIMGRVSPLLRRYADLNPEQQTNISALFDFLAQIAEEYDSAVNS